MACLLSSPTLSSDRDVRISADMAARLVPGPCYRDGCSDNQMVLLGGALNPPRMARHGHLIVGKPPVLHHWWTESLNIIYLSGETIATPLVGKLTNP